MLEVASVMGASFSVYDVAEVLGHPAGWLLRAVGEAVEVGIVGPSGQSLAFRDEAIREVVYESIPSAVRVALHRQIGSMLLAGGGRPAAAAEHLGKGAQAGDKRFLAGLDAAANQLRDAAPGWAADLALRALRLTEPASPQHDERVASAVEALTAAGRTVEATELGQELLARRQAPTEPVGRTALAMSSISLLQGRPADAAAHAEAVLRIHLLPATLRGSAELARFLALIDQRCAAMLRQTIEDVLAGGDEPSGDAAMAGALTALSSLSWDQGRPTEAVSFLQSANRRADRMPKPRSPYPRFALAARLTALGRFGEAEALVACGGHLIEEDAASLWSPAPPLYRARLQLARARLDDAVEQAELALQRADELGTSLFVPLGRAIMASVALLRGDVRTASECLAGERVGSMQPGEHHSGVDERGGADASELRPPAGPASPHALFGGSLCRWVEARLLEAREGAAPLLARCSELFDDTTTSIPLLMEEPAAAGWLTRVALAAHDSERATAVVTSAEVLAAGNPGLPNLVAAAGHARGLLDGDAAGLLNAAEAHRDAWSGASAAEDAGAVLRAGADRSGARAAFEQAFSGYHRIGAERDLARVRSRLRSVGVRRCHWSHESRPVSGWGSLTDTEVSVASLVAESLTNPQVAERMFLSRHTVDFHLRQIFRKLGIESRVALTRLVLEQQADGSSGPGRGARP
jgi:DNA-binding CsgD family transcriptional regulator